MLAIRDVVVVGAGQMGSGIAQVFAMNGFLTSLVDVRVEALQKARKSIEGSLQKLVTKQKLKEGDVTSILSRMQFTPLDQVKKEAQLVIEAVTEDENLKIRIFKELNAVMPSETIFASNTSSIPITKLAAQSGRPQKFIGMHFMNPVPIMSLIEVISGLETSQETLDLVVALAKKLGKEVSVSKDFPGFVVNRILMPMINEAFTVLMEGIATAEAIDKSMKLGTNHPMGPLELADFIGLDTCLLILEVMHQGLGDPRYRPSPLLRQYVQAGLFGRKVGRGVYNYS